MPNMETIDTSYPSEMVSFAISILIILWFTKILYHVYVQILKPRELSHQAQLLLLRYAAVIWTCIILRRLITVLFLNNFIIPFSNDCNDGSCLRCDIVRRIDICLQLVTAGFSQLIFVEVILMCRMHSWIFTIFLRTWVRCLTVLCIIVSVTADFDYVVVSLENKPSFLLCHLNIDTLVIPVALVGLVGLSGVLLGLLVVTSTLKALKSNTFFHDMSSIQYYKVRTIMNGIIRHCVLVSVAMLCWVFKVGIELSGVLNVNLEVYFDFVVGFVIYMFFSFGTNKYRFCFGYIQTCLFDAWETRHKKALDRMQMTREEKESHKDQTQPDEVLKLPIALSTIQEESAEFVEDAITDATIDSTTTTPHIRKCDNERVTNVEPTHLFI
eukprot:34542_1